MSEAEGELIIAVYELTKPDISLEIGFAYGISTLFACAALERNGKPCRHIVVDPLQSSQFGAIGLTNVKRAGLEYFLDFFQAPSEIVLSQLLGAQTKIQAVIIDGFHTFDHALIDFFYINKMLDVGGVIIFDDVNLPFDRAPGLPRYDLSVVPNSGRNRSTASSEASRQLASSA
jgi:predicted O-methyltransferase YrrM